MNKTIYILLGLMIILFIGICVLSELSSSRGRQEWEAQKKICDNLCADKDGFHAPDGMNMEGQCKCQVDDELKIFIYNN